MYWDERNQTYVLTRHDDVYGVLLDHGPLLERAARHPRGPAAADERDPPGTTQPRHRFVRNIVGPLFNPAAMRSREEIIRAIVREIVDAAEGPDVIEISTAIATPLPAWVALGLIGLPAGAAPSGSTS